MKAIVVALAFLTVSAAPAFAETAAHALAAGLLEFHKSGEFEDECQRCCYKTEMNTLIYENCCQVSYDEG